MIGKYVAFAAVAALCAAGQASAKDATMAQVNAVKGSVKIQQSGRMVSATNGSALRAGDRVVSMAGGQASVRFADGCVVALGSQNMVTVGAKSPCASGAGVVNVAGSSAMADNDGGLTGLEIAGWVATLVALTAGLGAVFNNDPDPVSP